MRSLILVVGARILTGLMLVFSIYTLLRGHNTPGGGFIGGLIAAAGFVLHAFAVGVDRTRAALRLDPRSIGTIGMILALSSGIASAFVGSAPFTGLWFTVGGLSLSTVLFFDTGVYLAVVSAILTLVFALDEAC